MNEDRVAGSISNKDRKKDSGPGGRSDGGPGEGDAALRDRPEDLQIDVWISALSRMSAAHPGMARILHIVARLQDRPYRSHALILGEPGTGKEGLAKLLHRLQTWNGDEDADGSRRPCERVQLLGLSPAEIAAELFGDGIDGGAWGRAQGGSLILDELLVLSADAQRRLHDALSQQRWTDPNAVVVIALSDGDVSAAVESGALRHDLLHKLGRLVMTVPPLRERAADLSQAALFIANKILRSRGQNRTAEPVSSQTADVAARSPADSDPGLTGAFLITPEALEALHRHQFGWPGNFRELEAVLERAILLYSDGDTLRAADVDAALADGIQTE
jgi:DNA-binding NtrC family response regulator